MTKFTASHGRYSARPGFAGLAALVLCAVLLLFAAQPPAQAAEWMEPYLEQVQDWGVMNGDSSGNLNEDRAITRAEFVVMMNRAFGYTETGPNPFTDVLPTDWFAEDICIAHQAGYFNGTSPTTAAPRNLLSREQAASLLARCLRLEDTVGSSTSFYDGNSINPTFRGAVQAAADLGIIQGYADGNFRPQANITRGQVACFLVRALGTLVQEPGEQIAGGVYGNLTINTSGVKLKDTVITGNLYLTGGVGLGNVELENVTIMGKIVLCGGGVSEKGENSVVLRNVTAEAMNVDSLTGQFLSIRAEGLTDVGITTVRSASYIEDMTENGLGLQLINLDAPSGTQLQLAGNIKEVVNLTPNSNLQVTQGVTNTITMDEKAVGATLDIANKAIVGTLNLDTATSVTGTGSVSNMTINTDGSTVTMLPDTVIVRPGVSANVNGSSMDTIGAAESSEDPRLLSGYPMMKNVASTSAEAVFSTNKAGTIYWALTALIDGSVGEDTLMTPSTNARVIKSGTLNATASNTELTARQTGLTKDGSYYISAMLVDNRGRKSPVKVVAFTTTDDTTPNFATGYPYTILTEGRDGEQVLQAMVMPTKDCQLYYALLPNNASAPTAADFRAGAIPGNLGFGVVDVKKNVPYLIPRVNSAYLEEQTTYNLYLWLNDADNNKSSAVRKLVVTTLDKTPPTITNISFVDSTATTATFTFSLDEPGTLYWAVVKQGQQFYARVPDGTENGRIPDIEEEIAKIQVETGTNSLKHGRSNAAAAGTDYRFTVTGLQGQTRYDLYFVAKDRAGNYNVYTVNLKPPIDFSTLDNVGPTVSQEFTHDGTDEGQSTPTPFPDTGVRLVFSETVQGIKYLNGQADPRNFLNLYNTVASSSGEAKTAAKEALGEALNRHIKLYYRPASGQPVEVAVRNKNTEGSLGNNWVVDYREAIIELDPEGSGEMIITLPAGTGLNLDSGVTYYFTVEDIFDTSAAANRIQGGTRGVVTLPRFTTIDAQLYMSQGSSSATVGGKELIFDMNFKVTPLTASNVSDETMWDMIFWSSDNMTIDLYSRKIGETSWARDGSIEFRPTAQFPRVGVSVTEQIFSSGQTITNFEKLKDWGSTEREFGIIVTSLNGVDSSHRDEWTGTVSIDVMPISGDVGSLRGLVNLPLLTPASFTEYQGGTTPVKTIGAPSEQYNLKCSIRDTTPPTFISDTPTIVPGDTGVVMNVMLSRSNTTYYYVIEEIGHISTTIKSSGTNVTNEATWELLPESGVGVTAPNVSSPVSRIITNPSSSVVASGSGKFDGVMVPITVTEKLQPSTKYIAYFVLQGGSMESISDVYAFRFETEEVVRPVLTVGVPSPNGTIQSDRDATVYYALVTAGTTQPPFNLKFSSCVDTSSDSAWSKLSANEKTTYGNYTVLEAMRLSAPNPYTGSLFDAFADPINPNVQEVIDMIRDPGSAGGSIPVNGGPISLSKTNNYRFSYDFTKYLTGTTQYWLVAIGQSAGSSSWAFRSNRYLQNVDRTPPLVSSMRTAIESYTVDGSTRYRGTLTITFSEALFYLPNQSDPDNRLTVVDKSPPVGDGYISSTLLIPSSSGSSVAPIFTVIPSGNDGDCTALTIEFSNCSINSTLTFSGSLCDANSNVGNPSLAVSLSQLVAGADPEFDFASTNIANVWDGRNLRA